MNNKKQQQRTAALVSADEEQRLARTVLQWLNADETRAPFGYETLDEGVPGRSMHMEPGSFKTREFITGGYQAQLRFSLWSRIQPGESGDARLKADESLNAVADWACDAENLPTLGGGCKALYLETNERAAVKAAYDNGDEDHRILLTLHYEKF